LLKTGKVPKWGRSILKQPDTFIIEDSIVNPKAKFLTSITKNISHARIMKVEEVQTYQENRENPQWTSNKTEARIVSNIGWGLTRSLESFGISNFQKNTDRSRKGMSYILEKIREQNPILNYRNHQTQGI
ncbi:MSF1-domain-containing protein, partial [Conidiobolus coronatus NRRL 28638]